MCYLKIVIELIECTQVIDYYVFKMLKLMLILNVNKNRFFDF